MSRSKKTLEASFAKIKEQHAKYEAKLRAKPSTPRASAPSRRPPADIKMWPEVFQHRQTVGGPQSAAHVRELAKVAKARDLAPLTVWWDGKAWACIDGHHRIEAYKAAGREHDLVPVEAFEGTPAQALAEAARRNSQDKLPMSRAEKTNAAWRLVVSTDLSKRETVDASGVGDGSVGRMRAAKAVLEEREPAGWRLLSWLDAKALSEDNPRDTWVSADEREAKAQEVANLISKAVGAHLLKQPDIMAMALEKLHAQLPSWLMEEWRDDDGEGLEGAE